MQLQFSSLRLGGQAGVGDTAVAWQEREGVKTPYWVPNQLKPNHTLSIYKLS